MTLSKRILKKKQRINQDPVKHQGRSAFLPDRRLLASEDYVNVPDPACTLFLMGMVVAHVVL